MTNRQKRFPASFRFVAVTFALIATASLATSAAADPPSAEQVQNAKDRVTQLAQEAHAAQRQLDAINIRAPRRPNKLAAPAAPITRPPATEVDLDDQIPY